MCFSLPYPTLTTSSPVVTNYSGEAHPDANKNPYNTLIMITDAGEINLVYRSVGLVGEAGSLCQSFRQSAGQFEQGTSREGERRQTVNHSVTQLLAGS